MAELVGLIASIATLSKSIKIVSKVVFDLKDTGKDIEDIKIEIQHLRRQIELLQQLQTDILHILKRSKSDFLASLNSSLDLAVQRLCQAQDQLVLCDASNGMLSRARWILMSKKESRRILNDIQSTRLSLDLTLNILSLQSAISSRWAHGESFAPITATAQTQSRWISLRSKRRRNVTEDDPEMGGSILTEESDGLSSCQNFHHLTYTVRLFQYFCVLAATNCNTGRNAIRTATLLLLLPFSRLLVARLQWQTCHNRWLSVSGLGQFAISLPYLVGPDTEFFQACSKGDLIMMRQLLRSRRASPYEINENLETPMKLAIDSGSVVAVQLLLDEGLDVESRFGEFDHTALTWAVRRRQDQIMRLLLRYGASLLETTSFGWNTLFFPWRLHSDGGQNHQEALDMLEILIAEPEFTFAHQDFTDQGGYSVIHYAVKRGTTSEVDFLLRAGVSAFKFCGPLLWTAIERTAYDGRPDIFEFLLPHYYAHHDDVIHRRDTRGWTCLHIAASAGHDEITRYLLRLGADSRALSDPSYSHMPEKLYGKRCTPAEVAEAQSVERKQQYLRAVRDIVGELALTKDELEDIQEECWLDAPESMENGKELVALV